MNKSSLLQESGGGKMPAAVAAMQMRMVRQASGDVQAVAGEDNVYEVSVSSNEPYRMNFGGVKIDETLLHNESNVRLDRLRNGANILFNHDGNKYIGKSLGARVDGNRMYVRFKFADHDFAQQVKRDVESGMLRNVSIGYKIWEEKGEKVADDHYRFTVTDWEGMEASVVAAPPADFSVGFGRADEQESFLSKRLEAIMQQGQQQQTKTDAPAATPTDNTPNIRGDLASQIRELVSGQTELREALAKLQASDEARKSELLAQETELSRKNAILEAASVSESLPEAVRQKFVNECLSDDTKSAVDFQNKVIAELERIQREEPQNIPFAANLGLSQKDVGGYNVCRFLESLITGERCIELEMAEEIEKKRGEGEGKNKANMRSNGKGNMPIKAHSVPWDILANRGRMEGVRDAMHNVLGERPGARTVTTGSGSAQTLVDEVHMAGSWIDVLRDHSVLMRLVTMLPGLQGNIQIPRLTSSATWARVAEDADRGTNDVVFDEVTMAIKTSGGGVPISRRLLQQGTPGAQAIILANIAYGQGLHFDTQGIAGNGSGENSTGVLNVSGIGSSTYANFTGGATYNRYTDLGLWILNGVIKSMMDSHAYMGRLAWVFGPAIWRHLASVERQPGTDGRALIQGSAYDGTLLGHPYHVKKGDVGTNVIFGNWADTICGIWNMLELGVDTTTGIASGRVIIRSWSDFNFAQRHAASLHKLAQA